MGHGWCETFNKQTPLSDASGRATSDAGVIAKHAIKLLQLFDFDCTELRGLAIHIQKLESPNAPSIGPQPGQGRLPFAKTAGDPPTEAMSSREQMNPLLESPTKLPSDAQPLPHQTKNDNSTMLAPSNVQSAQMGKRSLILQHQASNAMDPPPLVVSSGHGDASKGPPSDPTHKAPAFDLPSFSQVDQSVFEALPEDVRKELSNEYDRRSRSRSRSITPMPRIQHATIAGPSHKRIHVRGMPAVQRIVRQLATKRTAPSSPTKSKFLTKGTGFSTLDVSEHELRRLDIDIDTFMALPRPIQREQLARARMIKSGKPLPTTQPRKTLKAPKYNRPRGWLNPFKPPPRPVANLFKPPALKQAVQRPDGTRDKVFISDKDDVEDVIERWVDGFQKVPPNRKDVEFFATFLVKSVTVQKRDGTDACMEKAIRVLHWWQVLLRRDFATAEHITEGSQSDNAGNTVGFAWWKAFRDVKSRMDEVFRQRFGGQISL
jgi:DNA repair protein REV1